MTEWVTHATVSNPTRLVTGVLNIKAAAAYTTGTIVYISADNTATAYAGGDQTPIGVTIGPAAAANDMVPVALNGSIVKVRSSCSTPITAGTDLACSTGTTVKGAVYPMPTRGGTTVAATQIGTVIDDLSSSQIVYMVVNIQRGGLT